MTQTEMELRVARALKEGTGLLIAPSFWDKCAKIAIQAMREPTADMVEAGDKKSGVFCEGVYLSQISDCDWPQQMIWQAMINAASPERE